MKLLLSTAAALAMLAFAAPAQAVSMTDDPNVPNCTLLGPNAADCEWVAVKIGTSLGGGFTGESSPCPDNRRS